MSGQAGIESPIVAAWYGWRLLSTVLAMGVAGRSQYISTSWQVGECGIELAVSGTIEPCGSDFGCGWVWSVGELFASISAVRSE